MGAGHIGATRSQSRLTSFLPFAPDSQSSNPHPHSGLLEGAQSCFRLPSVFQKLTKTGGEREGESFPVGIGSLGVWRRVGRFYFFSPIKEREGKGAEDS